MFCAPTLMCCAEPSAALTAAMAVNGGTITISTSGASPASRRNVATKSDASACVMFIFQFAAMIFLRIRIWTGLTGFTGLFQKWLRGELFNPVHPVNPVRFFFASKLEIDERCVLRRDKYEHQGD